MTDGVIESTASYPVKKTVKCTTGGELDVKATKGTISNVFVYAKDDFGGTEIKGAYETDKFTATNTQDIKENESYEVGYIVTKTSGVNKLSFNNAKLPKAYYVCMNTVEKDENDVLTPYKIIAYKAQPQRNFELSQSSEGDPAQLTITFDLLEDKDKNFVEMVEIEDEE